MLKSIVNGAEHDIISIPMKGKNLSGFDSITYLNDNTYYVSNRILNSIPAGSYTLSYFVDVDPSVSSLGASIGVGSTIASYDKDIKIVNRIDPGYVNIPFSITDADAGKNLFVRFVRSGSRFTATVTVTKVMLNIGSTALPYEPYGYQNGWEIRDNQNRIIWGREDELETTTGTLPFKGYGLDIKEYNIDGNMVQAAEKAYSITGTSPLDFQSNGSNATISISGNETQASNQAYTTSGTSPLSFNADGTNLTALSMDGNMNQASSQPYTVSGTSPISFMNNGTAIDYTVSGNMNQSGTPTPTSPITPQECGERTNQLIPYPYYSADDVYDGVTFITDGNKIVASGTTSTGYNFFLWRVDKFPAGTYTLSVIGTHTGASIYVRDVTNSTTLASIFGAQSGDRQVSFTTTEELHVYVYINSSGVATVDFDCSIMLNEGSTALPYEPNLYKVPLTIAGNTQNIYIKEPLRKIGDYSDTVNSDGSVTRVIKKLVLDGTENWYINESVSAEDTTYFYTTVIPSNTFVEGRGICTHFEYKDVYYNLNVIGFHLVAGYGGLRFRILQTIAGTVNDFKAFLASEYSAGHPVEVWYALQTPQTDTATVPTITPTSGNNTLSVDTTLAPSNITITSNSSVFPGNPITPIECGVKTENLFDKNTVQNGYMINDETGNFQNGQPNDNASDYIPVSGDYVSIYAATTGSRRWGAFYDSSKTYISGIAGYNKSIAIPSNAVYMRLTVINDLLDTLMVNLGSEQLPYEPYGKYKIPITIGSTTNNIFINQPIRKIGNYSDSIGSDGVVTRNIKKLVLDGTETFVATTASAHYRCRTTLVPKATTQSTIAVLSTHYYASAGARDGAITLTSDGGSVYFTDDTNAVTDETFKAYLAAQYQNGTPVEVWYVLQTPDTTETTTIPAISTVNGSNTLTTGTPITPSNITISTSSSVYPKNPIYPEECGDRTANLFDASNLTYGFLETNGSISQHNNFVVSDYLPLDNGISFDATFNDTKTIIYAVYDANHDFISGSRVVKTTVPFSIPSQSGVFARINFSSVAADVDTVMINEGSADLPYEPYGYKIPITIGSNTNYIYTKEPIRKIGNYADVVNSDGSITRKIYKLVLTGTEVIGSESGMYNISGSIPLAVDSWYPAFCSHYIGASSYSQCNTTVGYFGVSNRGGAYIWFNKGSVESSNDFKQFLTDQYTSGKPVTVWYILQTPTTEQTTIPTLTTVDGKNTATIGTTLAPSSITINATSKVYPNNPIIPEECGDLTENLWNKGVPIYVYANDYKKYNPDNEVALKAGTYTVSSDGKMPIIQAFDANHTQLSIDNTLTYTSGYYTLWDGLAIGPTSNVTKVLTITLLSDCILTFAVYDNLGTYLMLNSGNTAKPYEPYGKYKVPIINNGVVQNIYLNQPIRKIGDYSDVINSDGTVSRYIRKMVLDGTERDYNKNNSAETNYLYWFRIANTPSILIGDPECMCNYLTYVSYAPSATVAISTTGNRIFYFNFGEDIMTAQTSGNTVAGLKEYIASRYASGNPVTVWYVLATPETESITAPTISTIEGTNTIEVDTTLPPSKIDITLHGKYAMWNAIRNDVRNGTAPSKYPVGTILYDSLTDGTGIAFQVVGYDKHFDPYLTAQGYTHSMTLCEYKLTDIYQFDAIEAFLYTSKVIPAGTYRFTIPNYDATYGGNKTYYFTSTADLPKNSQIVMNWPYQQTPKTVTAYSPTSSITAMENTTAATGWNGLTLTEYVSGESPSAIDLGTIAGPSTQAGTSNYGEMNHIHRARYGSNNYLQSGLRQYINASTAANTWWKPQTIFDRPYANRNQAGKLSKLNQNLVSVLATPTVQSKTNSYFETTSLDGTTFTVNTNYNITTDKLFLLSPMEAGFNTTDTTVGTLLDYYIAVTSTDANNKRIKYRADNNNAYYWWLRTPNPSNCRGVRSVHTSGALNYISAYNSLGVATACIIQ